MSNQETERSKPIEWLTFGFAAATFIGGCWKFQSIEKPLSDISRQREEIALQKDKAESVSLEGRIYESTTSIGNKPVTPIAITFTNHGETPVTIKCIEFVAYAAPVDSVSKVFEVGKNVGSVLIHDGDSSTTDDSNIVGYIDPDAKAWQSVRGTRHNRPVRLSTLPPGRSFQERWHILTNGSGSSNITKYEVTFVTANDSYKWVGYVDCELCRPVLNRHHRKRRQPSMIRRRCGLTPRSISNFRELSATGVQC